MIFLLVFVLLIVNFVISAWNAYSAGRIWREVSGFMKVVTWSALILSVCGFLEISAIILGLVAVAGGLIEARALHALTSLVYLMIVVPMLGAGLIVTIHSWIEAYKRRDFGSIATAGWNTFAQGYNMYDAADGGITSALGDVGSFFSSSDDDDAGALAGRALVLLILCVAGFAAGGLTYLFFRKGRRSALQLPMQQRSGQLSAAR